VLDDKQLTVTAFQEKLAGPQFFHPVDGRSKAGVLRVAFAAARKDYPAYAGKHSAYAIVHCRMQYLKFGLHVVTLLSLLLQ
jgi:hypothetical protein